MSDDPACEFPRQNASDPEIDRILKASRTIAVVGLSPKPDRPSHDVAKYLQAAGYRIVPVNPGVTEVLGERSYASLADIPFPVDLVDVFRRPEEIPPLVAPAARLGAKAFWMQLGIVNNAAADAARALGMVVVMNKCTKIEHAVRAGRP